MPEWLWKVWTWKTNTKDCKSYKPAVIKTVWNWSKDKQIDKWNRM